MKYIYFIEGIVFVIVGSLVARVGGMTAIIATSIVCTSLFTLPYGIWRTRSYFSVSAREMPFAWVIPPLRLLLVLAPIGAAVWYSCAQLGLKTQLIAGIPILGSVGTVLLLRLGIHRELKDEIRDRAPASWRPALGAIMSVR